MLRDWEGHTCAQGLAVRGSPLCLHECLRAQHLEEPGCVRGAVSSWFGLMMLATAEGIPAGETPDLAFRKCHERRQLRGGCTDTRAGT